MNCFKSYFTKFHIVFFFLTVLFAHSYAAEAPSFVVVIDAGHGGHDPGALGSSSQEKGINLAVALAFGQMIEKNDPNVKVIYTRKTDKYLTLQERADVANNAHADLFLCVHSNANNNPEATGAETYTLGLTKSKSNLDVAMRENSVILLEDDYKVKYEGFNPKSVDSYIMFECIQDKYLDKSVQIASDIQKSFADAGRKDRGVRQAGFWVLHKTAMPSILVEVGYITNPEEEHFLNSTVGQQKIATAIYTSFEKFRKEYARKSGKSNYVSASAFDQQNQDSSARFYKKQDCVNKNEQASAVEKTNKNDKRKSSKTNKTNKPEPDTLAVSSNNNKKEQGIESKKVSRTSKGEKQTEKSATLAHSNKATTKTTVANKQTLNVEVKDTTTNVKKSVVAKKTRTRKAKEPETVNVVSPDKTAKATTVAGKQSQSKNTEIKDTVSMGKSVTAKKSTAKKSRQTETVKQKSSESLSKETKVETTEPNASVQDAQQDALVYKLQLFAVSKKLPEKTPLFKGLKTEYFEEGTFFKYTYGSASDYATIVKLKKQIAAKFPNAMIIGFKNGKKVPVQ